MAYLDVFFFYSSRDFILNVTQIILNNNHCYGDENKKVFGDYVVDGQRGVRDF